MNTVNAAIITIGDELLIGQTIDTNSAFIGQELNKIGIWVKQRVAIGDVKEDILQALEAQSHMQVVIITGGLGPTADDITKPTLCEFFGGNLVRNPEVEAHVRNIFARVNRPMAPRNLLQADVPDVCTVLHNARGTAPGMLFQKEDTIYISLPGVPHEMKGLIQQEVIPRLQGALTLPAVVHRTLITSGAGESVVADTISAFESALPPHIKLAYLPSYGTVRLRLTGRGDDRQRIQIEVDELIETLKPLVKAWLIADEDITLEAAVNALLKRKGRTLSTAESCTGGALAQMITSIPGASAIFKGSVVAYDNAVKQEVLGVTEATLQAHGAVSEATVKEMASGALKRLATDYAVATSGIMGPGGGTAEKPVGTVWIALAKGDKVQTHRLQLPYDRARNIQLTSNNVLTRLYHFIRDCEGESAQ